MAGTEWIGLETRNTHGQLISSRLWDDPRYILLVRKDKKKEREAEKKRLHAGRTQGPSEGVLGECL